MSQYSEACLADSALRNEDEQQGISTLPASLVSQLVAEIARDRPNALDLDLHHLFAAPTVAEFAALIAELVSAEVEALADEEVHRDRAGEAEVWVRD